jgi:hypothetical protein
LASWDSQSEEGAGLADPTPPDRLANAVLGPRGCLSKGGFCRIMLEELRTVAVRTVGIPQPNRQLIGPICCFPNFSLRPQWVFHTSA